MKMDQFFQLKVRGWQNELKKNVIQVYNAIHNRHSLDSMTRLKNYNKQYKNPAKKIQN